MNATRQRTNIATARRAAASNFSIFENSSDAVRAHASTQDVR
jgi:hypothetical protein